MVQSSAEYHRETRYDRYEMSGRPLDWENQPSVFKTYPGIAPLPLSPEVVPSRERLSSLLERSPSTEPAAVDIAALSLIFRLTYSLTAEARYSGRAFYYRSVASAGALYPAEIYVTTNGVCGLDDGLYHLSIAHYGLSPLVYGNLTREVIEATGWKGNRTPSLAFFFSAVFFRSAWKYRDRSYRYHLLDTGHLVENLSLALTALELPFSLSYDFEDGKANRLLGLDSRREASLAVAVVPGPGQLLCGSARKALWPEVPKAGPTAPEEKDCPAVRQMHAAGERIRGDLGSGETRLSQRPGPVPNEWVDIGRPAPWPERMDWAEAVLRRRSRRNFVKGPISSRAFTALLDSLCSRVSPFDHSEAVVSGFLLGRGQAMESGFYLLDEATHAFGLVKHGAFMGEMAHVCLDQAWLANAAAHFLFMADLETIDRLWGARGYRYAMMNAGRLGERLYLAATALGLGCCGIGAFYDEEAANLLGLGGSLKLLYLAAVGPVKSAKTV